MFWNCHRHQATVSQSGVKQSDHTVGKFGHMPWLAWLELYALYHNGSLIYLTLRPKSSLRPKSEIKFELRQFGLRLLKFNDMIRDRAYAILMCARKPIWISLIYRMGPTTTKKSKTEILKSKKNMLRSNSKHSGESVLKKKEKLR